jgi:membrane associated rhomboid family serine protease
MPRLGSSPLAFPSFRGATRRLIFINLGSYFALAIISIASSNTANLLASSLVFTPSAFLHGALWQPITYSFVHPTGAILGTVLELLSLWFLCGFLEGYHGANWLYGLYFASVFGTALAALAIYAIAAGFSPLLLAVPLYGCFGGIFGLLATIGLLYGDVEFMFFPLPIGIKARYLAIIYGLIAVAMLFGQQRFYAFAQLGGALAGLLYARHAPRRGASFALSEGWYGLRNRYYRWKRRRAARKFEVYMRRQGRPERFEDLGRRLDNDRDPNDKKRWN